MTFLTGAITILVIAYASCEQPREYYMRNGTLRSRALPSPLSHVKWFASGVLLVLVILSLI